MATEGWPFKSIAYLGRATAWDTWDAMVAAAKGS
jgi:hypothetical protein